MTATKSRTPRGLERWLGGAPADYCVLVSFMMVVTTALYWLMFWHASRRPTYFPYFDAAFLSDFLWIHSYNFV